MVELLNLTVAELTKIIRTLRYRRSRRFVPLWGGYSIHLPSDAQKKNKKKQQWPPDHGGMRKISQVQSS